MGKKKKKQSQDFEAATPATAPASAYGYTFSYTPGVADQSLQRKVTELMHRLLLGTCTLAEIGYLHMNSVLYDQRRGRLSMRIYFDARVATRDVGNGVSAKRKRLPVPPFQRFENYLFVGDAMDSITFEEIMAPRVKLIKDRFGRVAVELNDDKVEKLTAAVLHCNFPIAMAAIHDHSVMDPQLSISVNTIGSNGGKLMATGNVESFPVSILVRYPDGESAYDPEEAVSYLRMMADSQRSAAKNQRKLEEKARRTAKEKKDREEREDSRFFDRYS